MVLLADGQEVARRQLAKILMGEGHTVIQVGAAADVLRMLDAQKPPVMVVDLEMLGEYADVLLTEVAARHPQLIVVAIGQERPSAAILARVTTFMHRSDLSQMLPELLQHALRVRKAFARPLRRARLVAV